MIDGHPPDGTVAAGFPFSTSLAARGKRQRGRITPTHRALEERDDIQKVFANFDISDEVMSVMVSEDVK